MGAKDHKSMVNLDPRGIVGRIYVGNHYKIYKLWASWFLKVFSQYKSKENLSPQGGASLDPRGSIGRIYVGDH